jgi:hypothetical protein
MDLARASSNLSAKRGAAVGVARIARLAATAAGQDQPGGGGLASLLGPDRMAALLPKLYRLTHDPSPKVGGHPCVWVGVWEGGRIAQVCVEGVVQHTRCSGCELTCWEQGTRVTTGKQAFVSRFHHQQ